MSKQGDSTHRVVSGMEIYRLQSASTRTGAEESRCVRCCALARRIISGSMPRGEVCC